MPAILAIDAAWTLTEPSGVALVRSNGTAWHSAAVAPSYEAFSALSFGGNVNWSQTSFRGSAPDASAILAAAQRLLGPGVDLITIDMLLQPSPFSEGAPRTKQFLSNLAEDGALRTLRAQVDPEA